MEHKHAVQDTNARFTIDPITKTIKNASNKQITLIQFDHNSERFTFEIPRYIEGHDMSSCNEVEVHFINIDHQNKQKIKKGKYTVKDLATDAENDKMTVFSWLISQNGTQLQGMLKFLIRFKCVEDGIITYSWNTGFFTGVSVGEGSDIDESFEAEYVDIIAQWKDEVMAYFRAGFAAEADRAAKEYYALLDDRIDKLSNYVTPQMFGAKGDGVTDDTEALVKALNTGKALYLPKADYYCPANLILPVNAKVVGNQSTLIDCVICANNGTDIQDIKVTGSGYIAISTEKVGQSVLSVSLSGIHINTSAETAILFECGGEASRYIYNVNVDDVRIDGSVKYGIRFKNNYNDNSKTPWMTCINISNVFMDQFGTAILMDYDAPNDYSFDTNPPIVTNSLMSFANVRGQWLNRSEHFVDCQLTMSNVHFIDSFPVDYRGEDGKRMFNFASRRFKNTDLHVSNVSINGAIVWIPTLFNEVEIENTTNKVYDFTEMFSTVTDAFSPARLMLENPYVLTTHLKNNAAVVRPIPTDDWKEQNIAKAHGVGIKMLASIEHGGDAPIIGGNILGYPIVSTDKGSFLVMSGRYMPVFYAGNPNYTLPSSPCVGYMVYNDVSKKPMWWTGSKWVYADGSAVSAGELV